MKKSPPPVNYLYYGSFFLLLILTSSSTIFSRGGDFAPQAFFLLYALGQSIMETLLFIALGQWLYQKVGKKSFYALIGFSFIVLCIHGLDFMMTRVLDLSILEAFKIFVWDETWSNFLFLLDASGIALWMWGVFFLAALLWPLVGIGLYVFSTRLTDAYPMQFSSRFALQAFVAIPCALAFWDYSAAKVVHPDGYTALIKSIPWKMTFFHPENVHLQFEGTWKKPMTEQEANASLHKVIPIIEKPNVYLFVVETLREDAITPEIAPHLYAFKNQYTHFDKAVSNANGTMTSWFSIFFSQFALHWKHLQTQNWRSGSPALAHMKKLGYQTRVYTSAQLGYYGMEKLIFGSDLQLIDSYQKFHHEAPKNAADSDVSAINAVNQDLTDPTLQQGQFFIIFLDGTHFDYSWPKDWTPKFSNYSKALSCFQMFPSRESIRKMKHRYWNSVHHVDHLFGKFFKELPKKEEAIVIFTGDHAEEFFEKGNLFHNSHLVDEQLHIPLYMKFGNNENRLFSRPIVSQMDIFPSLIDYLSNALAPHLRGQSIFRECSWPYALSARFNGANPPYEFALHNGNNKLLLQFCDRFDHFNCKQLRIVSLRTKNDRSFLRCTKIKSWIRQEFGGALKALFEKKDQKIADNDFK